MYFSKINHGFEPTAGFNQKLITPPAKAVMPLASKNPQK